MKKKKVDEEYWFCVIGPAKKGIVPMGGDLPLRRAVINAFERTTGVPSKDCYSGWGVTEERKEKMVELL